MIINDISKNHTYLFEFNNKAIGTFTIINGDPIYDITIDGSWLTKGLNYASCRRMAVDIKMQGKGYGSLMLK